MTHVLVKWPKEKAWDVYPVRALVDTSLGLQLLSDITAIKALRGRKVLVVWKEGEPAAEAQLLGFGSVRQMERLRTRSAARTYMESSDTESHDEPDGDGADMPGEKRKEVCSCGAAQKLALLEEKIRSLERDLEEAQQNSNALELSRNLRKVSKRLEKMVSKDDAPPTATPAPQVDIGGGVAVEAVLLERLETYCKGQPTKYARHLLRSVFSTEELQGKSLSGKTSNANKGTEKKEGLDPVRLNAVISYTCAKFGVPQQVVKASLSSLVSREIKAPGVQPSTL
ncbi:uncharacterized protein LOC144174166 [Haemaphysalis longicornis]